jgi:Domain of unknown function (DUF4263)
MDDPILAQRLARIRNLYKGESGYWGMVAPFLRKGEKLHAVGFITNLSGVEREVYDGFLIPAYQRLKRRYGLKKPPVLIGSCDSFVDLVPEKTQEVFANFVNTYQEGIAILLSESAASVNGFVTERCLSSGVLPECKLPYEPALVSYAVRKKAMLTEFESLINSEASEKKLEEFIATHYKDIFGAKYDRVETQLWLRFPQLDVSGKCRRLDIFLRNAVVNDWELFEVKRPIKLSKSYRDVPALVGEVLTAVQQTKNYARTLSQDVVKRHFAKEGIVYYEPMLSVVIGRTPQIPLEQWQWLRRSNEDRVRIITFDDLLNELRFRLEERLAAIEETVSGIGSL